MEEYRGVLAGILAAIGVFIESIYVYNEWGLKWLAIGFGAALILVAICLGLLRRMQDLGRAAALMGSVLLALALAAAPVAAAGVLGGTLDDWIPVYLAGAIGGLVLELIASRGQVELPGPAGPGDDDANDPRRPLLPQIDLGVLARFILGGLAAVVVLMIGSAAGADDSADALERAASADLSIAWAIAIGSASAAVWQAIGRMVQARLDAIAGILDGADAALAKAQQQAQELGNQAQETGGVVADGDVQAVVFNESRVRTVMTDALTGDRSTIDIDDVLSRLREQTQPVSSLQTKTLLGIGATLGAVDAARAQLGAAAKRAGLRRT